MKLERRLEKLEHEMRERLIKEIVVIEVQLEVAVALDWLRGRVSDEAYHQVESALFEWLPQCLQRNMGADWERYLWLQP